MERTHIEVFRGPFDDDLRAAILYPTIADKNALLYAGELDFMILFGDGASVILERVIYDYYLVTVNEKLLYTCFFPAAPWHGILIHIFKEDDQIKIAPASESMCVSNKGKMKLEEKRKRRYERSLLSMHQSVV